MTNMVSAQSTTSLNWPTPQEVCDSIKLPYKNEIDSVFKVTAIANLIFEYIEINRNATKWVDALKKLNHPLERVPPPPSDLVETLYSDCRIFEGKKIIDSHTLFLIPPGSVDEISKIYYNKSRQVPYLQDKMDYFSHPLRTKKNTEFASYEWILVTELIPDTRDVEFKRIRSIEAVKNALLLNYEFMPFKYALAASFLNLCADEKGLWTTPENNSVATYVIENSYKDGFKSSSRSHAPEWVCSQLAVGTQKANPTSREITLIKELALNDGDESVGVALYFSNRVQQSNAAPKSKKKCAIS